MQIDSLCLLDIPWTAKASRTISQNMDRNKFPRHKSNWPYIHIFKDLSLTLNNQTART